MTAHWGIHDPAVEGSEAEQARAFNKAFRELDAFENLHLRLDLLDKMALKRQLDDIGRMREERQLK
jgi:hypothetical protein